MKTNNYKLLTGILVAVLACISTTSAQTATWNVASGNWSNGFNWNPIGDPSNASVSVIFNNGGSLTLDSGRTVGSYSQTGGIFANASGQSLRLNSGGSLDGGGVMNLVHGFPTLTQSAANVLFTNTNGTIQGFGHIGNGLSLLNQANGIIIANNPTQTLDLNGSGTFTNNGLMRAENGGNLQFDGSASVINNTTIRSENSSYVTIQARIIGGILDNTGSSGIVRLLNGTLRDVTIANGSTVTIVSGWTGFLENTLINNGTFDVGNGTTLQIPSNTTLSGGGTLALSGACEIRDFAGGHTLSNTDNTVRGYGTIGRAENLSVINGAAGIIQADVSGQTLSLNSNSSASFTNNGLMRAQNGGNLLLQNGLPSVINNATIRSENGSYVTIQARIIGGTLDDTGSSGIIQLQSGTLRDLTIANGSTVTFVNGYSGNLENTLINRGTLLSNNNDIQIPSNTTLSGGGTIALSPGVIRDFAGGHTLSNTDNIVRGYGEIGRGENLSVINGAAGIIQADVSGQTLQLNPSTGSFTNNGLFAARNGGTLLRASGTFTNFSGSTLTGGAYLTADSTLNLNIAPVIVNAATVVLSGPASVFSAINSIGQNDGTFVITNGRTFGATPPQTDSLASVFPNVGTLILGPNDSSFAITGDYAQGSGSVLEVVIGADYPSASFHHLNVSGSANLAGTLEIKLANGYVPAPNQTFEIIHANGGIDGGFVTVNGATVTYTATGVFIHPTGNTTALQLTKAVSRKTHGPAGALDINLPLTGAPGVECRSSGGNHTLVFTFSNNLVSGNASRTSGTGTVSGSPTFAGKTMTVNLTGVADAQLVTLTLRGLTDVFSQVLPDQTFSMGVLLGDTTGNGTVSSSDVSQTKLQTGITVTEANARQDVTVNGAITASDLSLVKTRSGSAIP